MKIFRDLSITGPRNPAQFEAVGEEIARHLPASWMRDRARENDNAELLEDMLPVFVFERAADSLAPKSGLVMARDGQRLSVANLVPIDVHQLSIDQYNAALEEFYRMAAKPACDALGYKADLTPENPPMTAWMTEGTFRKLSRFSAAANKSTGSSHPRDQERWMDFIIAATKESAPLKVDILKRWLIEEEGWDERTAGDLAIEYEFGRALLNRAS